MAVESRAEYFRRYRKATRAVKERDARQEGVREGIELCAKFCREILAARAYTGFQTALHIERAMIAAETPEVTQRRAVIDSLRGQVSVQG